MLKTPRWFSESPAFETKPRFALYFTFARAFRRSAQYFFIRAETAFRAAADIRRVRRVASVTDRRTAWRACGSFSSGKRALDGDDLGPELLDRLFGTGSGEFA